MSEPQVIFCGSDKQYLDESLISQSNASNGGNAFRIPSIVNANGTLVAVADRAGTGADWGYIELAVRTSTDGGKSWSDIKTIAAPPAREASADIDNTKTAFYIDPCMTVAQNGDIVMLVTFFPESKGFFDKGLLKKDLKKAAYALFDGKKVQLLYDIDGNYYMVLGDGSVLDGKSKTKTEYTVKGVGELYKKDEYVGNIYLNSAIGKAELEGTKTTFGAPLKAPKRSYVFMIKSTDNGESWSEPKDITADILNENDGYILVVAPGTGLTTQSGRIIMPLYTLKGTVAAYSDDNGETWCRNTQVPYTSNIDEWTAVQAPSGEIYSFGRARMFGKTPVSISENNGVVFISTKKAAFKAPKCQKNALVVGDRLLVSHPSGKKRENGVISVGRFDYNKKGVLNGIKWDKQTIKLNDGFFAYSCMAKIDDHTVGILYEDQPSSHIVFDRIDLNQK